MARKLGNHRTMKRGEDKFSAQDHFFIFALFVLMELWVGVQGEIQCSCLHTLWQTLMSQFQLEEDDRDVTQSSQHHRVFEGSIQVDSQRHMLMRKKSTRVDKVFPYYLRETMRESSGSSLQVPENHWTKSGLWVFHSPHLPNIENANLKKTFLQMIIKNYLTHYFIISSLVEPWRIFKLLCYHIISINRCCYYCFSYHYHPCELMLHEYWLSSRNVMAQKKCLGNGVEEVDFSFQLFYRFLEVFLG